MSGILDEIRGAYAPWSIEVEGVATYGTYYRLRCRRCGKILGAVGDKLLPGMVRELVQANFDLYAAGLMGCACGCQAERANAIDPARAAAARARLT
jgi:hypothetical protein